MHTYLGLITTCAALALAVGPALAQSQSGTQSGTQSGSSQSDTRGGTSSSPSGTTGSGSTSGDVRKPGDSSGSSSSDMRGSRQGDTRGGMTGDSRGGMDANTSGKQAHIRKVQEQLKAEGHDPGPIDGVMGPQTKQAIRAYQRQENLPETGQLDQQTMSKLGVEGATGRTSSRS